jgi:hypothetical protein
MWRGRARACTDALRIGGINVFGSQFSRVKLEKRLVERARRCAPLAGYSSVEEFVSHAVERAVVELESAEDEDELKRRLKGLGYLS